MSSFRGSLQSFKSLPCGRRTNFNCLYRRTIPETSAHTALDSARFPSPFCSKYMVHLQAQCILEHKCSTTGHKWRITAAKPPRDQRGHGLGASAVVQHPEVPLKDCQKQEDSPHPSKQISFSCPLSANPPHICAHISARTAITSFTSHTSPPRPRLSSS